MLRVLALVVLAIWPRAAWGQAIVSPELLARPTATPVRVVVRLRTPVVPESALTGPAVAAQRADIRTAQDAVIGGLSERRVSRLITLPFFAIDVSPAEIASLAVHPLVAAIDIDTLLRPSLIQSTELIRAPVVWQSGYDGSGWAVAVLDTGSDGTHPFLAGKVTHEACFSTTDASADSLCPGGASQSTAPGSGQPCLSFIAGCDHGTHVAGIAVGHVQGLAGVARGSNLIPIQVFSSFVATAICSPDPIPCARAYTSDVARGLEHVAVLAGAGNTGRVAAANLSLGGGAFSSTCDAASGMAVVKAAVDALRSLGIPTVVASGNDGFSTAISAPACVSTAISVGSTLDVSDGISTFSNRASFLSLVAPGSDITSSVPGDTYEAFSGTSMAAPHVAGAWSVLKELAPTADVATLLAALRSTGASIQDAATGLTYPRIRLDRAAQSLVSTELPGVPSAFVVSVGSFAVHLQWQPPLLGGPPTDYQVEAGSTSGATNVGVFSTGGALMFSSTAPEGIYYVRVRARNASGAGPATPDIRVVVGVGGNVGVPLPPRDLRADVIDRTVTLTWNLILLGSTPASFFIDVGTASGASNVGSFEFGADVRRVSSSALAPGIYFARVRAANLYGVSGPSNEARFTVAAGGPCTAAPAAPTTLAATVTGRTVRLSWLPPGASGTITGHIIEAGSSSGASNLLALNTRNNAGTYSATVPSGVYYVRVRAVTDCGVSVPSNEIVVTVP
jgi:hypothetical protein